MTLRFSQFKKIAKFIIIFFLSKNTIVDASDKFTFTKKEDLGKENNALSQPNIIKSQYLLGPGDGINIIFNGLELYSGFYVIDPDGFIDLPEIRSFYVKDLTIQELNKSLTKEYKKYIINPDLKITLTSFKPITVYISGEVRNPGVYTFKGSVSEIPTQNKLGILNFDQQGLIKNLNTRLYDAIRKANGVNNYADLANIKIIRKNSNSQGGGKITTTINLLSTITKGDLSQNIRLYDEDYVIIPKSEKILKKQVLAINNLNINPDKIKVYITGNVVKSGGFTLDKGASLTQAIASTGGKKLLSGNVEFLRFNDDGTTEKYRFRYNDKSPINSRENPILMNGDIINVNRTLLGTSTEILREVSNPILSGYGLYKIFN